MGFVRRERDLFEGMFIKGGNFARRRVALRMHDSGCPGTGDSGSTLPPRYTDLPVTNLAAGAAGLMARHQRLIPSKSDETRQTGNNCSATASERRRKRFGNLLLVIAPKGENARIAGKAQARFGEIHILDPFKVTSRTTAAHNPLDRLTPDSPDLGEDAAKTARTASKTEGNDQTVPLITKLENRGFLLRCF